MYLQCFFLFKLWKFYCFGRASLILKEYAHYSEVSIYVADQDVHELSTLV